MKDQIVVIGGGITGLSAAIELARAGAKVTLLERARSFGGRGGSVRESGFALNFGGHAIYPNSLRKIRELGVTLSAPKVVPVGLLVEGERAFPMPDSPLSLLGSPAMSAAGKWQLARTLASVFRGDPAEHAHTTTEGWVRERISDPRARSIFLGIVRLSTYVHAPERLSAGAAIAQLREAFRGVCYVDGGWQSIVEGLLRVAEAAGVRLRAGAKVEGLERLERLGRREGRDGREGREGQEGGWRVRLGDGEAISASGLLLATSPKVAARLLGPVGGAPSLLRFAEEATPVRAASLDLGLRRLPRTHPSLILGLDRPLYLSTHSLTAKVAPEGGAMIHASFYLVFGEEVDARATRRRLEVELERAQPGFAEEVEVARFAPAWTVMHALPEARQGGLSGRPKVEAAGLEGVALAGDWVGPEGMLLDACLKSAEEAVAHLLGSVGGLKASAGVIGRAA